MNRAPDDEGIEPVSHGKNPVGQGGCCVLFLCHSVYTVDVPLFAHSLPHTHRCEATLSLGEEVSSLA